MSYRFSDTSKWADEWFIDLSSSEKLMFMYLCDNCDIGGFYELSLRKLSFDLGLTSDQIKVSLKGLERGYILSKDKRVLFLKNFLKHQKNMPLNPSNMAHKGIFKRFENYKNRFEIEPIMIVNKEVILPDLKSEIKGASKGLQSPLGNGIGIIDYKDYKGIDFENFWNLYGKKVGDKKSVIKKWNGLKLDIQKKILNGLPEWKKQFTDIQFMPYPETYLTNQRWDDEFQKKEKVKEQATIGGGIKIDHR